MTVRHPYKYDRVINSDVNSERDFDDTLTVQSMAEEADINTIVRRFGVTGQVSVPDRLPSYEDYDGVFDFQSAQQALIDANRSFMELPARVRSRFDNDPQQLLMFVSTLGSDDALMAEAVELGLVSKPIPGLNPPAQPGPVDPSPVPDQ